MPNPMIRRALASGMFDPPFRLVSQTLQPSAAAGIDTQLYKPVAFATSNYGIGAIINTGWLTAGPNDSHTRGLIKFAYTLPSDAINISAILTLTRIGGAGTESRNTSIHRSLVEWFEGEKNGAVPDVGQDASVWSFRNYNGSVAWGAAGGQSGVDYVATPTATTAVEGNAAYDFDVTADVVHWKTNTNLGWWILGTIDGTNATFKQFAASDNATAGNRPKLVITYKTRNPT